MTSSAAPDKPAELPRWWWARGLSLRERLAAPRPPTPGRKLAPARPASFGTVGDPAAFAARLAGLGLRGDLADALGEELPERLGARVREPRWARFVDRAVAEAPSEALPQAPEVSTDGPAVFLPVLRPLIARSWDSVAARTQLPESELGPLRTAFEHELGWRLAAQSARTLVKELSLARTAGRLRGSSPRERFAAFIAGLRTRQGLSRLFAEYPVLARITGITALDAADAAVEFADRFHADRPRLVAELFHGVDPGSLVRLDLGRGDPHQGNRSVALLHFERGSAVYKPRPLAQHALLDDAVGWLNGKVGGLDLRTPRTVRAAEYGWLEFIEHRWCASDTEADLFYRRQGALLALLYAIDGTDVHYENLIACGDQPVLVDAETLVHSGLPAATTAGDDPAARALEASVHRTGLLPHLLIGDNGALDLSALGQTEGGVFPSDMMRWEGTGTDEMRVTHGAALCPGGKNQPRANAGTAGHVDHRAALLAGFRAGYDAIARHRAELLDGDSFLARWAQAPARLIVRPTRLYATLLEESVHPDLLHDALARDAVFALLWTESRSDAARQRLIEEEIADLWRGDVPLFQHRPGQRAVWTSRGSRLDDVLPAPALATVLEKLAAMSEVDRYDQEWVIAATLAVNGAENGPAGPRSELARRPASAAVLSPARLLTAACGIADEVAARAVIEHGRANWLCMERVAGRHWAVLPMGGGLAEGYCGVALFLAQIGALAQADRYTTLAREAVRPLPLLLSALAADPELSLAAGPGALSGLGGILYTLVRLSALVDKRIGDSIPDALTALTHVVDALDSESYADRPHTVAPDAIPVDLADGLAGALVSTALVHETLGCPEAEKLSRRLADRLLPQAVAGRRGPGFAHGDAGIGWALSRYARQPSFAEHARPHAAAGTALLLSALDEARAANRDFSWYSGLSGVLLAAVDALDAIPDGGLESCVRVLGAAAPSDDLSLCQGDLGMLEPLIVLARQGHDSSHTLLTRRAGHVLGFIEQQGHICATPDHVHSPGLLTGSSGIGYALLRLGFPEIVPSIAMFETNPRQ